MKTKNPQARPGNKNAQQGPQPRRLVALRLPPATIAKIRRGARVHGSQANFIVAAVDHYLK